MRTDPHFPSRFLRRALVWWATFLATSVLLAADPASAPVRIMAVGDSITEGGHEFTCYRPLLAAQLTAAGRRVEFVGSRTAAWTPGLRHEGYGGKNIQFLADTVPANFERTPADIVLLHAGHNHFADQAPVPGIVAATERLITALRAVNPRVTVLLAQVIPAGKLPKYSYLPELNRALVTLAARLHAPTQSVVIVDQATGFDWQTDTVADLVHPNATGAAKMAQRWFAALAQIVPATAAVAASSPPSPAASPKSSPASVPVKAVRVSSTYGDFSAAKAIDGSVAADSRWTSARTTGPSWIELEFAAETTFAGVHVINGLDAATALKNFEVQFWRDGAWAEIPSAKIADNRATAIAIAFDDTVRVRTSRLRLWITATHDGYARIKEIAAWPDAPGGLPPLAVTADRPVAQETLPLIYLNQSGFNLGKPKRFTAPTLADGTPFEVRPASGGGAALFSGKLSGHIGDFSAFDPADDAREFVVVAGPHTSVPFRIGQWWLERVTYQNAVNFMVDSRHYVGNSRPVCRGSFGWRDDHHFGWELHTLVPQWLSNPSAFTRMPRQITYEAPTDPKLWGALTPYRADIPDLVKLIHWGADIIVTQRLGHEHLKAQLAYFLYAWPWLRDYLPEQNYAAVRDYAFATWTTATADRTYPYDESPEHDLLALKTKVGTTKGCYPPGFSIEPNLLLYAVARREGSADAERYFDAAHRQTAWLIANLDWNDPLTTKGQRMSEWLTLTALTHFLREYPDRAPAGLVDKINAWAQVVVRRSANLWDFRKLDDAAAWTPTGPQRTMWNEPGNVVGLPAALLIARPHVRDAATRARLHELAYAHLDNFFGRNPAGRHFSYDAPREVEGVEHGWYSFHKGGIGQLEKARFVIDGSPKNQHYPYHPEVGDIGWTEGWVQFNVAFNQSLTTMAFTETTLTARFDGDDLIVRLTAPLNFDYAKVETAEVVVTPANGAPVKLLVTEDSPNARTFSGRMPRLRGTAVEVSYGFGYLAHRATLSP